MNEKIQITIAPKEDENHTLVLVDCIHDDLSATFPNYDFDVQTDDAITRLNLSPIRIYSHPEIEAETMDQIEMVVCEYIYESK